MNANERDACGFSTTRLTCVAAKFFMSAVQQRSIRVYCGLEFLATGRGGVAIVRGGKIVRQWCEVKS